MTASSASSNRRPRFGVPSSVWYGAAGIVGLAVLIEIISRSQIIDSRFVPPFSAVMLRATALSTNPEFLQHVGATMQAYLLGISLSILIAVPAGIVLGLFNPVYKCARALIELIRPIPPVALIPLVLLLLGAGLEMKLVIVVFAAVWPIVFNTLYGVHDVDPYAKEMARTFGVSKFGVIRRVVILSAAPFIMTGIRIASSIALIVVITVELIAGGAQGIGAYIAGQQASLADSFDTFVSVLAATIIAGVLGLLINLAIGAAERRFFGWDSRDRT